MAGASKRSVDGEFRLPPDQPAPPWFGGEGGFASVHPAATPGPVESDDCAAMPTTIALWRLGSNPTPSQVSPPPLVDAAAVAKEPPPRGDLLVAVVRQLNADRTSRLSALTYDVVRAYLDNMLTTDARPCRPGVMRRLSLDTTRGTMLHVTGARFVECAMATGREGNAYVMETVTERPKGVHRIYKVNVEKVRAEHCETVEQSDGFKTHVQLLLRVSRIVDERPACTLEIADCISNRRILVGNDGLLYGAEPDVGFKIMWRTLLSNGSAVRMVTFRCQLPRDGFFFALPGYGPNRRFEPSAHYRIVDAVMGADETLFLLVVMDFKGPRLSAPRHYLVYVLGTLLDGKRVRTAAAAASYGLNEFVGMMRAAWILAPPFAPHTIAVDMCNNVLLCGVTGLQQYSWDGRLLGSFCDDSLDYCGATILDDGSIATLASVPDELNPGRFYADRVARHVSSGAPLYATGL